MLYSGIESRSLEQLGKVWKMRLANLYLDICCHNTQKRDYHMFGSCSLPGQENSAAKPTAALRDSALTLTKEGNPSPSWSHCLQ